MLALQEGAHARRVEGKASDQLILVEHSPVYTLGTSAEASHILYPKEVLRAAGIECVETSRGGDVTYHGPGQLVGYPIVHLGEANLRVIEYVTALEEVIIRAVAAYGISAVRDPRNRGVWVGDSKLAAIGIRVSRQVAMHGFALNVNTRLEDYGGIVACGLRGTGITSMSQLLGAPLAMQDVKQHIVNAFKETLNYGEP
jgi:lipoate-protein ligase B